MMADRLAIEIPKRLRSRPRDPRGYPIPWIVLIDRSGQAQFTINDVQRAASCVTKKLCSLCGRRFDGDMWFIGGSRCFMHKHGAFIDPPNHRECAEYALQVCPFLAASSYAKRIDDKKLKPENMPEGMVLARVDHMLPSQPERFGLGCTKAYRVIDGGSQGALFRVDRWDYIEWWKNGVTVSAPDSLPLDQPMVRF